MWLIHIYVYISPHIYYPYKYTYIMYICIYLPYIYEGLWRYQWVCECKRRTIIQHKNAHFACSWPWGCLHAMHQQDKRSPVACETSTAFLDAQLVQQGAMCCWQFTRRWVERQRDNRVGDVPINCVLSGPNYAGMSTRENLIMQLVISTAQVALQSGTSTHSTHKYAAFARSRPTSI